MSVINARNYFFLFKTDQNKQKSAFFLSVYGTNVNKTRHELHSHDKELLTLVFALDLTTNNQIMVYNKKCISVAIFRQKRKQKID